MTTIEQAAAERGQQTAQRADRPGQRRSAQRLGSGFGVRASAQGLSLRAKAGDSGLLEFTGHASVTERGYEMWDWAGPYTEVVSADAFDVTLARADLDVPLVLGHDQMRRIASTRSEVSPLALSIDEEGLYVEALSLDPNDHDVAYIAPKLRAGLITEMSFAFRIDAGTWSPDWTTYRIEKVDIHRGDTAIVGYGANPLTDAGLRAEAIKPRTIAAPISSHARALLELALTD